MMALPPLAIATCVQQQPAVSGQLLKTLPVDRNVFADQLADLPNILQTTALCKASDFDAAMLRQHAVVVQMPTGNFRPCIPPGVSPMGA